MFARVAAHWLPQGRGTPVCLPEALPPPPTDSLLERTAWTSQLSVDTHVAETSTQECWVTVYGFSSEEAGLVLRELALCGEILQYGASPAYT